MRKKNVIMMALTLTACVAGSFPVNVKAADLNSEQEIVEWLEDCNDRSDSNAEYEGINIGRASGNKLVASDVWIEYSGAGTYFFASGYTDVKTSSGADAYHYTRTEYRRKSKTNPLAQQTEWGYGFVAAETADVYTPASMDDVYGIVFWGD